MLQIIPQSLHSYSTPNFRINTSHTNPQKSNSHELNKYQTQSKIDKINELSFHKPTKHLLFAADLSQSDLQAQETTKKNKNLLSKKANYSSKKAPSDQHPLKQQYSPQIIKLLQNCKASIETLQQELNLKNLAMKKIQHQKNSLYSKISDSQKQNQRIQQILNIYIKESKQTNSTQNKHFSRLNNTFDNQLKSKIQELQKTNCTLMKENEHLKNVNTWFQTEINQLNAQNNILTQKIHKMGNGVGKALSTIKKNNKISEFILVSERKPSSKLRQHGKISTHSKRDKKIVHDQKFQTPTKTNKSDRFSSTFTHKSVLFCQKSQERLVDISRKAKRLDQLQKLEQILCKMQKLAEQDDQQSENLSH